MKTSLSIVMLASLLLCVSGCKTRSLSRLEAVPITEGLTESQALDAVALASSTVPSPIRTRGPIKSYEDGAWNVLDRDTNSVLATYSLDRRSVTVRYTLEGRTLVPRVETGLGVRLSESRIHGNVLSWIRLHAANIKAAMWKIKSEPRG